MKKKMFFHSRYFVAFDDYTHKGFWQRGILSRVSVGNSYTVLYLPCVFDDFYYMCAKNNLISASEYAHISLSVSALNLVN